MSFQKENTHSGIIGHYVEPKDYLIAAGRMRDDDRECESIDLLYEAVEIYPENFLLRLRLGKSLFYKERYDKSVTSLLIAHNLNPNDQQAGDLLDRARVQADPLSQRESLKNSKFLGCQVVPQTYMAVARNMRDHDQEAESIEMLYEAVDNFPEDVVLRYQLGKSLYFQNRFPEAIDVLVKAQEIDNSDSQVRDLLRRIKGAVGSDLRIPNI